MTLHPDISFSELVDYCRLCHEHGDMARRVKVDKPTLQRIRQVSGAVAPCTRFLGVKFIARQSSGK